LKNRKFEVSEEKSPEKGKLKEKENKIGIEDITLSKKGKTEEKVIIKTGGQGTTSQSGSPIDYLGYASPDDMKNIESIEEALPLFDNPQLVHMKKQYISNVYHSMNIKPSLKEVRIAYFPSSFT
jgi:hypothetical protein